PMDFSAWFEVYLGDRWYTFDGRHNIPRIGRILIARGRDATDVAITTSFGVCNLVGFEVVTDEVVDDERVIAYCPRGKTLVRKSKLLSENPRLSRDSYPPRYSW